MSRIGRRVRDAELSSGEKAIVLAALNDSHQLLMAMPADEWPSDEVWERLETAIQLMERA